MALGVGKPSYLERCPPAIEESPTTISLSFPSLSQKLEMIKINSLSSQATLVLARAVRYIRITGRGVPLPHKVPLLLSTK